MAQPVLVRMSVRFWDVVVMFIGTLSLRLSACFRDVVIPFVVTVSLRLSVRVLARFVTFVGTVRYVCRYVFRMFSLRFRYVFGTLSAR